MNENADQNTASQSTEKSEPTATLPLEGLPTEDGYYWMRNFAYDDAEVWRVIFVQRLNGLAGGRYYQDGIYFSMFYDENCPHHISYLDDWEGLRFYPINQPHTSDSATQGKR